MSLTAALGVGSLNLLFAVHKHLTFQGSSSNCSIQENYTSVAYSSWPFRILCNPYVPVEDLPWDTEDDYVSVSNSARFVLHIHSKLCTP